MTTMIPVPAEYVTHDPPLGNWRWLAQLPVRYLNGQRVYPPITEFQVWRWSKPVAQIAERIALREWERVHGWEDTENKAGAVQYMVQLMALDQCGVFNAMSGTEELTHPNVMDAKTKHEWNWPAWACFCRFFAGMDQANQLALLGKLFAQDCTWADWFFSLPCEGFVYFDPWYQTEYVYQLPRKGPFPFGELPFGAPPVVQNLPPEAFPPDKRPPVPVPPEPQIEPPVLECPEGMQAVEGQCVAPPPPAACDGVIDPTTGQCILPPAVPPVQCPAGQMPGPQGCVPLPAPPATQCDPGFVYDPASGICVAGGAKTVGAKSGKVKGIAGWQIAAASLLGIGGIAVLIGTLGSKQERS
jgi:hypothetical protein